MYRSLKHLNGMAGRFCARFFSNVKPSTSSQGYVGFGSFHSDNVEELIRIPSSQYSPPARPVPFVDVRDLSQQTHLGTQDIKKLFQIDFKNWDFINHGAFGASLLPASIYASSWRDFQEQQPLRFFDRVLLPEVIDVYRTMASWIGASPLNIAILQNVTTALNTIVKSESVQWQQEDEIVTLNIGYGAVKTLLKTLCRARGSTYREIQLEFPLSSDSILEKVVNGVSDKTKFLLIDHVTSNTAIKLPIEQIAQACSNRGIVVAVDGAHSLLNLPLNCNQLESCGVDYFTTNTHKWLCSPKGAGILWVSERARSRLQPLVLSHGSHHGFTSAFSWDGCHDYTAILSLPACLAVWQALGVDRVRSYIHTLAQQAASMLSNVWGTSILAPTLHTSMCLVELPVRSNKALDSTAAKHVQDYLFDKGVECPVKAIQGRLYVRISAHVYNTMADYEKLSHTIQAYAVANSV